MKLLDGPFGVENRDRPSPRIRTAPISQSGLFQPRQRYAKFWWAVAWTGIAIGIYLRAAHLGSQSLWLDEGYTAWLISHSPAQIVELIRADTTPPGYYLLLNALAKFAGASEAALRAPSAVFSIITMLMAMDIARRLLREPAAIAAAAWAIALSYLQVRYAREARAYALMGLLAVAAFEVLLLHLDALHSRWLAVLAALFTAMMYTHNMMAPYIVALLLPWTVLPSHRTIRKRLAEIAIAGAIALLLYLPWAVAGLPAQLHMIHHAFWVGPLTGGEFCAAVASVTGISRFTSWELLLRKVHLPLGEDRGCVLLTGCLLASSAIMSFALGTRASRRQAIGLLAYALLPLLLVALYGALGTPLFMVRLFLPTAALLPIFVLMPLGIPQHRKLLPAAWSGAALLIVLSAFTIYGYSVEYVKEDWRAVANVVSEMPAEPRLIVFVANDAQLPFEYYYHYRAGDEVTGVPRGFFDLNPPRAMQRIPQDGDLTQLRKRIESKHYAQIILIEERIDWADPRETTLQYLKSRCSLAGERQIRSLGVFWFTPSQKQPKIRP